MVSIALQICHDPELDGSNVTGTCYKVIDGDTIYVSGLGKVRLVGVNIPK